MDKSSSPAANRPATGRIVVSGHHIDPGDALKEHAESHIRNLQAKYRETAYEASVVFSRDGHEKEFACHIKLHLGSDMFFEGKSKSTNVYTAFNSAFARAAKQLRRQKRAGREDKGVNVLKATLVEQLESRAAADPL
jgi:ribosomal subunit interface protein